MKRKMCKKLIQDGRGFSLLEVLLGISVFMIGMLGVTALNISSLKSNTFSGNLSEASLIAATKIEELMALDFDDPGLFDENNDGNCHDTIDHSCSPLPFINQDADDNSIDDSGDNFGLDDTGADADYEELNVGKLGMFTVYWNVAENEPISIEPDDPSGDQRTKTINVIVEWMVKDEPRRISMDVIRMKEE